MEATGSEVSAAGLVCVGLSHHTTDIGLREKIHVQPAGLPETLARLGREAGIEEAVILSTCNRFEIYTRADPDSIRKWILGRAGPAAPELSKLLKISHRLETVEHLFSVAGGLEAQIIGETQILGQVRDAYEVARTARLTGPVLNPLFQRAIAVGKRLRAETRLSETPVSVSSVAVRLCEKIFGKMVGHSVLVVGAGEIAAIAAEQLFERGARLTLFSTRSRESAEQLARLLSAECLPLDRLGEWIPKADMIISASGAPHQLIGADEVRKAQARRKFRPLFLVDLAVPRDIDPSAEKIENVFLYNLDDLQSIAEEHRKEREKEIPACLGIVREEAAQYWDRVAGAQEDSALRRFHEQIAEVVDQELRRSGISGEVSETLKKSIPNRLLAEAFKRSRNHFSAPEERQALLKALKEFFGL